MWLDDLAGFDLFYMLEADVRAKKLKYDEDKRKLDAQGLPSMGKHKKKKIMLRETDGKNYKSSILNFQRPLPYMLGPPKFLKRKMPEESGDHKKDGDDPQPRKKRKTRKKKSTKYRPLALFDK